MRIKYLSLLMAAMLLTATPSVGKDHKEKAKTEQTAKKKKGKDDKEKDKDQKKDKDAKKAGKKGKKGKKGQQPQQPQKPQEEKPSIDRKGLFGVTKVKNEWFFHIADSLIGRDFLTTTRYTTTPSGSGKFGGEQVNEQTVYFQLGADEQMLLRANLIINVADSTQKISRPSKSATRTPS